jgi:hypothetical protein
MQAAVVNLVFSQASRGRILGFAASDAGDVSMYFWNVLESLERFGNPLKCSLVVYCFAFLVQRIATSHLFIKASID